jgi:hypothetical protein
MSRIDKSIEISRLLFGAGEELGFVEEGSKDRS